MPRCRATLDTVENDLKKYAGRRPSTLLVDVKKEKRKFIFTHLLSQTKTTQRRLDSQTAQ